MWYELRGVELPDIETTRSSVGHSHVLSPELRTPEKARYVARRLTLKAASRLRRLGYEARAMTFSMRIEDGPRLGAEAHCVAASDSLTFLHLLDAMWAQLMQHAGRGIRIKKLSVTLIHLTPMGSAQQELFAPLTTQESRRRAKAERMSRALDTLNQRFGRDTVALGMLPSQGRSFSGTKIAFTRIPDAEEFLE
jgi:DNA polymerase-4